MNRLRSWIRSYFSKHLGKLSRKRLLLALFVTSTAFSTLTAAFLIWKIPEAEGQRVQSALPTADKMSAKEQAEFVDSQRNTLVSGLGTVATIAGGIVLILNFSLARQRLSIDVEKIADDRKLSEARLTAERFSKAIEQLGNSNIHIRIGGIYSLEQLVENSISYQWTVIEVLSAFIRETVSRRNEDHEALEMIYASEQEIEEFE